MTEETLFAAALEKGTPAERAAFLDEACSGDSALRQRIEALLQSHEQADFMKTPAIQQAAEFLGGEEGERTIPAEGTGEVQAEFALDFLAASDKPDSLGRLGHHEIFEVIGRGGMGVVLRGLDEKLHRVVAIKVMAVQLASSAAARRRFTREAQAAAAVSHDHIVTIHAVEEANGLPYLVMHYVAGMSLQQRLDCHRPLQLAEILRIGMQTASGLAAAHAQGLIHRDIKPANILLENGVERVKITDFGLARAADDASLTQSGVVAGTPQYMAPEQARGESIDQRADLFSLGSVLYAMCTGRAPFRAAGTMAVLSRVCNEMPSPIREANPEVPDWLVAIIEKLHAKNPAERYQSAREVAELLGKHLAHVQHPSVVPLPSVPAPIPPQERVVSVDGQSHKRRRRWAVVAAALLLVLGSLSLTEATGVTNFATNVIRVFTPDGTLVVESADPAIKVTVEGDGGLFITGTGVNEIHLRPGSYKVHADRDGRPVPLDRELVSITKGGVEVVRVKMEGVSAQTAGSPEQGVFVVLAAGRELKFNELSEAVQGANDGDTIEVRGNGPFHSPPVKIRGTRLIIRAGDGFRPSIWLQAYQKDEKAVENVHLIDTESDLTLEGLEFRDASSPHRSDQHHLLVVSRGHSLRLLNCRFLLLGGSYCVGAESPVLIVSNCEFLAAGKLPPINWQTLVGKQCLIENCLLIGGPLLLSTQQSTQAPVQMIRTTVVTDSSAVTCNLLGMPDLPKSPDVAKPIRLEAADNIFATASTLWWQQHSSPEWKPVQGAEAEDDLSRLVDWSEKRNVYLPGAGSLTWSIDWKDYESRGPKTFPEWNRFWKQAETGSLEGRILFQGGSDLPRLLSSPEKIAPGFFRLRADSTGYRAGVDGKDLGPDVDLVGPGPAYERWKKTPGYQRWGAETGQKAAAVAGEPDAFVVIGGQGVPERRFQTLAEAMLNSTEGDTIEVRGNGPFRLEPIELQHALTIRAGAGSRPVLIFNTEIERPIWGALCSFHPLRLEGLELRSSFKLYRTLYCRGPLWVANCRFQGAPICIACEAAAVIRNCELLTAFGAGLEFYCNSEANSEVANSIVAGHLNLLEADLTRSAAIRFRDNTFVSPQTRTFFHALHPMDLPADQFLNHSGARVRIAATENIFAGLWGVYCLGQFEGVKPRFDAVDAENWAPRRLEWEEQRNLFRSGRSYIGFCLAGPEKVSEVELNRGKSFEDWNQFWGLSDTGSSEGIIRFHGGDLFSRSMADVSKLTPGDFRLRPDSAGYQAGMDGKDLGADVDLVGPGAAYEKWKESPDYQQWLIESQPVK